MAASSCGRAAAIAARELTLPQSDSLTEWANLARFAAFLRLSRLSPYGTTNGAQRAPKWKASAKSGFVI